MTPNIATAIVVGKTLVSLVVSFQSKKRDRKEKVVVKLWLHFKFLSISFSVSVGNGKLIPSEKKTKEKISEWPDWLEDMLISLLILLSFID